MKALYSLLGLGLALTVNGQVSKVAQLDAYVSGDNLVIEVQPQDSSDPANKSVVLELRQQTGGWLTLTELDSTDSSGNPVVWYAGIVDLPTESRLFFRAKEVNKP